MMCVVLRDESWHDAGESAATTSLEVTAALALPGGPRQLFAAPRVLSTGQTAALPFDFTGVPATVSARIVAVATLRSRTGRVLMVVNSSRLFQRFVPPAAGIAG
jgi:hypothetical protein